MKNDFEGIPGSHPGCNYLATAFCNKCGWMAQRTRPYTEDPQEDLWRYIEEIAKTDAGFYACVRMRRGGQKIADDQILLSLIKFLKTQRDNLFASATNCAMYHPAPIMIREDTKDG
jgi:hypothetical protein